MHLYKQSIIEEYFITPLKHHLHDLAQRQNKRCNRMLTKVRLELRGDLHFGVVGEIYIRPPYVKLQMHV
jgi:hypothetical protein